MDICGAGGGGGRHPGVGIDSNPSKNAGMISLFSQAAEDVHVTFEDQQKINKFARNTSRITELKEEIDVKKVLKLGLI